MQKFSCTNGGEGHTQTVTLPQVTGRAGGWRHDWCCCCVHRAPPGPRSPVSTVSISSSVTAPGAHSSAGTAGREQALALLSFLGNSPSVSRTQTDNRSPHDSTYHHKVVCPQTLSTPKHQRGHQLLQDEAAALCLETQDTLG